MGITDDELMKNIQNSNYEFYTITVKLINMINSYGEYDDKLLNVGFILNNKMFEIINYIKDHGILFVKSFVGKAINHYFLLRVNYASLLLSKYTRDYALEAKKRFIISSKKSERLKYLDEYNHICNEIYNFSIKEDCVKILKIIIKDLYDSLKKENIIDISIEDFSSIMYLEMQKLDIDVSELNGDYMSLIDGSSDNNEDYYKYDKINEMFNNELNTYKKINGKK